MADQQRLLWRAILVSVFSVSWSLLAGGVAVATAFVTRSPSLAGFGIGSVIDATASLSLIWYFHARRQDSARADRLESLTLRAVGSALIVAAAYVAVRAIPVLGMHTAPDSSEAGIVIAAASALVLPLVALTKLRIAGRLPSAALRSDGVLTVGGALLACLTLVAVSLKGVDGLWWVDGVAALLVAAVLAAEGTRGWVAHLGGPS